MNIISWLAKEAAAHSFRLSGMLPHEARRAMDRRHNSQTPYRYGRAHPDRDSRAASTASLRIGPGAGADDGSADDASGTDPRTQAIPRTSA
jgi:hypothetical protein